MAILKALCVALSTYSIIPVPVFEWTEENTRHSLAFFPVVGIVIAVLSCGWYWLCVTLGIHAFLFAVGEMALPCIISGGIHLDGFCDTVDALASHQSRERKLEIMHDSDTGAFAVIYCAMYLLLSCGMLDELYLRGNWSLIVVLSLAFVLSRTLSVWCAMSYKNARGGGMLFSMTNSLHRRASYTITIGLFAVVMVLMLEADVPAAACVLLMNALWVLAYRVFAYRVLGGVTGDTAGFFLQVSEALSILAVLIACGLGVA